MEIISIKRFTKNQPFCAGVIIIKKQRHLVVTINSSDKSNYYRIGAVSGGQEIDESPLDCAMRESLEETGSKADIENSPITYFHNLDSNEMRKVMCYEKPALLLIQYKKNTNPNKPYREGLPCGEYTYYVMYLTKKKIRISTF